MMIHVMICIYTHPRKSQFSHAFNSHLMPVELCCISLPYKFYSSFVKCKLIVIIFKFKMAASTTIFTKQNALKQQFKNFSLVYH